MSKQRLGTSSEIPWPEDKPGFSHWIEYGVWFEAETVDPEKFGPHQYGGYIGRGTEGTGNCQCGCYMGRSDSSGQVDPFGACPMNPKTPTADRKTQPTNR